MDRHYERSYAIFSLFRLFFASTSPVFENNSVLKHYHTTSHIRLYVVFRYFSGQVFQRPMINGL